MRIREAQLSSQEWEEKIGAQFRALRIAANLDQVQLAARASISVGALRNLERGTGSTLKTLVQVTRALGHEDWLESISSAAGISPIDILRSGPVRRSRVYRARRSEA